MLAIRISGRSSTRSPGWAGDRSPPIEGRAQLPLAELGNGDLHFTRVDLLLVEALRELLFGTLNSARARSSRLPGDEVATMQVGRAPEALAGERRLVLLALISAALRARVLATSTLARSTSDEITASTCPLWMRSPRSTATLASTPATGVPISAVCSGVRQPSGAAAASGIAPIHSTARTWRITTYDLR